MMEAAIYTTTLPSEYVKTGASVLAVVRTTGVTAVMTARGIDCAVAVATGSSKVAGTAIVDPAGGHRLCQG